MSAPKVVSVAEGSPAYLAGIAVGDEILAIDGEVPRDVIAYRLLVDEADPQVLVGRGHQEMLIEVAKEAGTAMGAEVSSAVFDRVRTCDNHCEFCFIYQLPKGMRRSLYLKDDDYRLSFLYGNFTTLTRFTELDLERVVTEGLSPLFVSIHATDPEVRASMLHNRRGAMSLRWLSELLAAGIEVHGQIVVCPGVNDGEVLEQTLEGILDRYPQLASVACVPLGLSRFSNEPRMREHLPEEALDVVERVSNWQQIYLSVLGRRMVYASDEYYLLAGCELPPAESYEGFAQHENGIGMVAAFRSAFDGDEDVVHEGKAGFFAWVDGAPAHGYRADRFTPPDVSGALGHLLQGDQQVAAGDRDASAAVTVLSGRYGAQVLEPLVRSWQSSDEGAGKDVEVVGVENGFFGGNISVAGLLTFADISRALAEIPAGRRVLLPDVCLSGGRFLDGPHVGELPRAVEVVPTDGFSLRRALLESMPRVGTPGGMPGAGSTVEARAEVVAEPRVSSTPVVLGVSR